MGESRTGHIGDEDKFFLPSVSADGICLLIHLFKNIILLIPLFYFNIKISHQIILFPFRSL
jgi:hypothetical protein